MAVLLARRSTASIALAAATIALTASLAARSWRPKDAPAGTPTAKTLVASIRAEPTSFNRYRARDLSAAVVTYLMHGSLVRVNRATNALEPELAERWDLLSDGRTYRLHLRPDVRFSDGKPFTSEDVIFSFRAIYDAKTASTLADSLLVNDKPLTVTAVDASTVLIAFPSPFGPGLRILDGVPMYPRHRLADALERGTLKSAWGLGTPPGELVGLGPYVMTRFEPGQRLTFVRNPHYWLRDRGLPRLDQVILEVLSDQDAELLQLKAGTIDLTQSELRPTDVPTLKRGIGADRVVVADSGIGLDGDLLWMNLTRQKARDGRAGWLQHPDFRRAIAHAVDRRAFVDDVYFGEAVPADGVISPGNREWHIAPGAPTYDVDEAKRLLAAHALIDRNRDGVLEDAGGRPARFTLLTQSGNSSLQRGAAFIKRSLGNIGVAVDLVSLEPSVLIDYVLRGDYDAAYFRLVTTDTDPALNLDFWTSAGGAHVWNPAQRAPQTPWEQQIDGLMSQMASTVDGDQRRALFADVQRIAARELPVLCFAFPKVAVGVSSRVANAQPAAYRPPVLWNPAALDLR